MIRVKKSKSQKVRFLGKSQKVKKSKSTVSREKSKSQKVRFLEKSK
jgi:hypothetical protein